MLRGTITIGRIAGVRIALHISWFIVAALLTISLAAEALAVNPHWPSALVWFAAVATALAFFAALVLHELAHALVARGRGVPVPAITLFAFGGMAHMSRDTADAKTEFVMGLAGPLTSALIGIAALVAASAFGWNYSVTPHTPFMAMLVWFGFINLTLAAFNMIPGFPLDGGRVLRALVWWWTGSQARATRIAARLGQIVAIGFIVIGFLSIAFGDGFGGLWLAFIGLFLAEAARASIVESRLSESLRGVRVADLMSRDCAIVEPSTPIASLAEEVLRTGRRCFFIQIEGRVAGLVTPQEIRRVPRHEWDTTPASGAMQSIDRLHKVDADAPVSEALDTIGREDVNQLPVLDHGHLRGIISRDQILRLLSARAELAM